MLKNDNLAFFAGFFWAFLRESLSSPYFGFWAVPAAFSILAHFYSPFISREFNGVLVFGVGILSVSAMNMSFLFFSAPFFLILALIFYVLAKK